MDPLTSILYLVYSMFWLVFPVFCSKPASSLASIRISAFSLSYLSVYSVIYHKHRKEAEVSHSVLSFLISLDLSEGMSKLKSNGGIFSIVL